MLSRLSGWLFGSKRKRNSTAVPSSASSSGASSSSASASLGFALPDSALAVDGPSDVDVARAAQEEADAEYAAALNAEAQRAADASPPPPKRQQRRDLRLTAESTFRTLELLLVALDLRRGGARPDGNNCLLFALLQCAGRLHADQQGWAGVPTALDELRRVLHERCLDHDDLAGGRVGAAASWC